MSHKHDDDASTAAATARPDRPWVLATWPEGSVHCDLPESGSLLIGRSDDCDLVVPHRSVSRHHARLIVGPPLRLEDLGSANGSKVGGRALSRGVPVSVEDGLVIEIGDVALLLRAAPAVSGAARPPDSPSLPGDLAKVERAHIIDVLQRCGGNQTRAATLLGISRRTLVNRLDEYGVPRPLKEPR
ncbi:MAG: Anaerobic nitric oxide reductase transcription regulator NorR [Labilithrix sp.]|jgi:hypothetical protein|nr:Anaerobic nitric oxide reductase transcription regulator NorR [Labilithrix sp.]